ncbi:MAG: DUF4956 domain-containing protein [Treponema sp.]|nr:DUF4956 domain-containing protein [Treponema sp.]
MEDLLTGFLVDEEIGGILFNMLLGLVAGAFISAGYMLANKKQKFSKNFVITVLLMPAIMAVIIPFVASDLKKTLSLAGIFALVRFRSIPGDSKDILYVFFSLSVGVMIALNSYFIAFATVFVISLIFILMSIFWKVEDKQVLKITIPEDMNYKDVFNDIFEKYLEKYDVKNVKTSNMGTLFTISYWIQPKANIDTKAFIDELRTRNGNLNIIIENPEDMEVPVL